MPRLIDSYCLAAHFLHRQAEKATRKGRVEEAVRYHKEAADILNELLQNILDAKVEESLRLQAQLHEKERESESRMKPDFLAPFLFFFVAKCILILQEWFFATRERKLKKFIEI